MSHSIKNTKEVLDLSVVITRAILGEVKKDGFQWADMASFLKSPEFEQTLAKAVEGFEDIDDEMKDLSFVEGIELARYAYEKSSEVIDLLKDL